YIALNAHWETHEFTLPIIPPDKKWYIVLSSDGFNGYPNKEEPLKDMSHLTLQPRSSALIIAK
ncbi:MAG: hypothetical protein IJM19_04890, partial [Ruminococcus sp.]|nr:hypothetical protein [Ruminococcus sp.]